MYVTKDYAPSYTFGIKHSNYTGALRLEEPYDKRRNIFHFYSTSSFRRRIFDSRRRISSTLFALRILFSFKHSVWSHNRDSHVRDTKNRFAPFRFLHLFVYLGQLNRAQLSATFWLLSAFSTEWNIHSSKLLFPTSLSCIKLIMFFNHPI